MPAVYDFCSAQFDEAVCQACHAAFNETLAAGLPVFYVDCGGLNVMECPAGQRWLPGCPAGQNYEITRELTVHAA